MYIENFHKRTVITLLHKKVQRRNQSKIKLYNVGPCLNKGKYK